MLDEYRRRRAFVIPTLNSMPGVRCVEPGGAFYAYPNIGSFLGKNGMETALDFSAALLKEAHVAVVPGEAFGTQGARSHLLRHVDARTRARA